LTVGTLTSAAAKSTISSVARSTSVKTRAIGVGCIILRVNLSDIDAN
jgi:hypothetical protein